MSSLNTSQVAYWKLDESSGNPADSVASYTLTNTNTVGYASAKINNGADFGSANTNKYLTRSDQCGLVKNGAKSISLWINITTAPASNVVYVLGVIQYDSTGIGYEIAYRDAAGTKNLRIGRWRNGTDDAKDYAYTLTTGTWYHIVYTFSGTAEVVYVNGIQLGTNSPTITDGTSGIGDTTQIGRNFYGRYVSGVIDEVGVWSKVLAADEVTALYNSGTGIQTPFNIAAPTTNILAYYKLDEASGNAADSVASHTLTNSNVTYAAGIINNGAVFNGTTDSLVTATDTDFNFERTQAFSFSFWTNQTTLANNGYPFAHLKATANYNGYCCQIDSTGFVIFNIGNNGDGSNILYVKTAAVITTNTWYHVVITYSGSSTPAGVHVYINGLERALTTVFNNLSASALYTGNFQLGSREGNSINYAGTLDEVGVWTRAITGSEVYKLYNSGAGLQYPFGINSNAGFFALRNRR